MALTFEQIEQALDLAADGVLPGKICVQLGISLSALYRHRQAYAEFQAAFNEARLVGAEKLAESTIDTALERPPAEAREINAAKWRYLEKLFPREYGEQVQVKVSTQPSLAEAINEGIARATVTYALPNSKDDGRVIDLKRIGEDAAADRSSVPTFGIADDDGEDRIP